MLGKWLKDKTILIKGKKKLLNISSGGKRDPHFEEKFLAYTHLHC